MTGFYNLRALLPILALVVWTPSASILAADRTIDSILDQTWKEHGVEPAPLVSDAEFLRRLSLDLIGRIPTRSELLSFQRNPSRQAKVEELLESPEFPRFWSEVWATILVGYQTAFESNREALRLWLEEQIRANRRFDEVAGELIAATGDSSVDGAVNFVLHNSVDAGIRVSRVFLGVQIDCARCHDHPFDRWKKQDYEEFVRFFAPLRRNRLSNGNVRISDDIGTAVAGPKPRFFTGAMPVTSQWRQELAYFVTGSKPFARTLVNRLWYHFLGRGIVHPPDNINAENPASVPQLLKHLTEATIREKFDLRATIRRICFSDAYRRSSRRATQESDLESVFAYRVLKPLTPEQLFDSAAVALDVGDRRAGRRVFLEALVGRSFGEDFTNIWRYRETVQDVLTKLTREPVELGGAVEEIEEIDEVFLRLLSRPPTERELRLCRGRSPKEVAYVLINSHEFFFNH